MHGLTLEEAGFDYSQLKTYSGYYLDNDKLLKSASGGAVSVISEMIIRQGGVVFGAVYSSDFMRAEYKCAETLEDLEALKGSKYCQTVKEIVTENGSRNVYEVLEEKLSEGRPVLFVGLGCDVGGAVAYCERKGLDTGKLFTVDILCHGPTTASVHRQYVEGLERDHKSRLKSFTVRYKKEGWTPPYIHAEFENGEVFETPFYESDYGIAFSKHSRPACYQCGFRGSAHKADMTCGDFWGLTESMSGWNRNGVSIMFVRTPKGEELIGMIDRAAYHIEEADTAFALENNRWYYKSRSKDKNYDKFESDLNEKGLHYAVRGNDMRTISAFLSKHKFINVIVCIVSVWLIMMCVDLFNVDALGNDPICVIETSADHYVGLGYSFDVIEHPVSGKLEYAFYLFGQPVKSNITNEIDGEPTA